MSHREKNVKEQIDYSKQLQEFKEDLKKMLNKIKEGELKENKCLSGVQENINETIQTNRDVKADLNKVIATLKKSQAEMKMK